MRIALIQHDIEWEDAIATRRRVEPLVARAIAGGASLVVFPEMFAVGFSMATDRVAEPVDGPTTAWLTRIAVERGVAVIAGVPVRTANGYENHAIAIGPDGAELARYAKIHPFSFGGEHEHFTPGATSVVFEHGGLVFGLTVCYDLRFPELYRRLMTQGANVLVNIANWPAARIEHWRLLLRARALENVAYAVGLNRVGRGGTLEYPGASAVIEPDGTPQVEGPADEAVVFGELHASRVARIRSELPFVDDLRGDVFAGLAAD